MEKPRLFIVLLKNIQILFNTGITRLYGEGNNLTGVDTVDLDTRSTVQLPAGTLVLATGRFPELIFCRPKMEESEEQKEADVEAAEVTNQWEAVDPYKEPSFRTQAGLFAKGDVLTDYSAAIKAIGAGRRAAASVHEIMYDITLDLPENVVTAETEIQNVDHVEDVAASARRIMPLCDASRQADCKEIELGFDETTARDEANRCLRCGLICYQHTGQLKKVS